MLGAGFPCLPSFLLLLLLLLLPRAQASGAPPLSAPSAAADDTETACDGQLGELLVSAACAAGAQAGVERDHPDAALSQGSESGASAVMGGVCPHSQPAHSRTPCDPPLP